MYSEPKIHMVALKQRHEQDCESEATRSPEEDILPCLLHENDFVFLDSKLVSKVYSVRRGIYAK